MKSVYLISLATIVAVSLYGQTGTQTNYGGSNATGLFTLSTVTNLSAMAQADAAGVSAFAIHPLQAQLRSLTKVQETPKSMPQHTHPALRFTLLKESRVQTAAVSTMPAPKTEVMSLGSNPNQFLITGLTHMDQRLANDGNQYSVEPASPSIAVADGYVLEGVNNAVQVYSTSGRVLLATPVSTNELFGLFPAIERTLGEYGPFPTDMRVFHDKDIDRWMVLQRAQDVDMYGGENLATSHFYMAVSQTSDPTGSYNVYTADTSDFANPYCPCVDDYPQIGADQNGFYISVNEMNSDTGDFVQAIVYAISKSSLGSGAAAPTLFRFPLPFNTGYEFAVQPATTPPSASYFVANGGLEYFVSTLGDAGEGNTIALWAMYNTSSLGTATPNLSLLQTQLSTLSYTNPIPAIQQDGPLPYGSSLTPPGPLAAIDGGDTRVMALSYAAGRLYLTFASSVLDPNNVTVDGAISIVLSPTYRSGVLAGAILGQAYLELPGMSILRPAVAVNGQGMGEIAATIVSPNRFPSTAYMPQSNLVFPTVTYVAGVGTVPEDGFTGYTGGLEQGIARWGDYSTAVAATDGSIWTVAEYTGNLPRTSVANWDTEITSVKP